MFQHHTCCHTWRGYQMVVLFPGGSNWPKKFRKLLAKLGSLRKFYIIFDNIDRNTFPKTRVLVLWKADETALSGIRFIKLLNKQPHTTHLKVFKWFSQDFGLGEAELIARNLQGRPKLAADELFLFPLHCCTWLLAHFPKKKWAPYTPISSRMDDQCSARV